MCTKRDGNRGMLGLSRGGTAGKAREELSPLRKGVCQMNKDSEGV